MGLSSFALFNLAGAALWAGAAIAGGLVFHDQIGQLLSRLEDLGNIALGVVAIMLALYVAWRALRRWRLGLALARLPRVSPRELFELMASGLGPVIVDVRANLMDGPITRIPGARHVDLASMETHPLADWPEELEVITYCACPNDASALRAAHMLSRRGRRVRVLLGGIDAWSDAGYALEEVARA